MSAGTVSGGGYQTTRYLRDPGYLTTATHDANLDLDAGIGQRQCTFRFELINGVSGERLGRIYPLREPVPSLSHDTSRTIKRQVNLSLGVAETASINTITDRVEIWMDFPSGTSYPLGRYMWTSQSRQRFAGVGSLSSGALVDEMFLVDQPIETGLSAIRGYNFPDPVTSVIGRALAGLPVRYDLPTSPFYSADSWGAGTGRGQVLGALALSGDYFDPWFDHNGTLRFLRVFDASAAVPDIDLDQGNTVLRSTPIESDDLLTAPNRFVVVSNAADDASGPVWAHADIPASSPNSIRNRGFVIPEFSDLQVTTIAQAQAVATSLALRGQTYERVELATAPDPRYDSYTVVRWRRDNWLETAWSMQLVEGGQMRHSLSRVYS